MNKILLCPADSLENDSSKGFQLSSELSIFLVKKNNAIYAYKNSCPHLGIELEWLEDQFLDADNQLIQCSTHGALFLIENGKCVAGPCQGQHLEPINVTINDNMMIEAELNSDKAEP